MRANARNKTSLFFLVALLSMTIISTVLGVRPNSAYASAYATVTFAENASSSDTVEALQTENVPTDLTLFTQLSPAFTNSGHTFVDWNTQPDGSGVSYADGQLYDFSSSIVLYAIWSSPYATVTFAENASSSDTVEALQTENVPTDLTLFTQLSPAFTNSGHTFVDWNTQPDGSGVSYADGQLYDFSSSIVLYAVWKSIPSFVLNFDSNGGSGYIGSITALSNSVVQIPSGINFSRAGYNFSDWNATPNGTGTTYVPGTSLTMTSSETLYAIWIPIPVDVTFDSNGGLPVPSAQFLPGSNSVVLPSPSRTGYTFIGWFSSPSGGTLEGVGGSTLSPLSAVTLFAQWQPDTYTESFNTQGASSIPNVSYTSGNPALTLPSPTRTGYSFAGWFNAPTSGSLVGTGGATWSPTDAETLYAQWTALPVNVTFSLDGASGSVETQSTTSGATITLPSSNTMIRPGFTFLGWNTQANGHGTEYAPGAAATVAGTTKFYAQWKRVVTTLFYGVIGKFSGLTVGLNRSMSTSIHRLARAVIQHRYRSVSIFGYAVGADASTSLKRIALRRAEITARALRSALKTFRGPRVLIKIHGEAMTSVQPGAGNKVEVFVE